MSRVRIPSPAPTRLPRGSSDHTHEGHRPGALRAALDVIAHRSIADWQGVLTPTGAYRIVGGSTRRVIDGAVRGRWRSRSGGQSLGLLVGWPHTEHELAEVEALLRAGAIRPLIDRTFPLAETARGLGRVASGEAVGKVVIRVAD